jgi:hypothetical protein
MITQVDVPRRTQIPQAGQQNANSVPRIANTNKKPGICRAFRY